MTAPAPPASPAKRLAPWLALATTLAVASMSTGKLFQRVADHESSEGHAESSKKLDKLTERVVSEETRNVERWAALERSRTERYEQQKADNARILDALDELRERR